jgi:hypothetical protein
MLLLLLLLLLLAGRLPRDPEGGHGRRRAWHARRAQR